MTRSPHSAVLSTNSTALDFHFGSVLGIVADQYRTLMEAILEAVQNGLDAGATKINVNINQKSRNVFVQDDGVGASKSHMDKCLANIAKSQKDRGKLGQFGIGVVASFGKCRRFTFMSQARGAELMHRWVFDCGTLRKATSRTSIPCAQVSGHVQWWNSELHIEDYTTQQLRAAIDFDSFCTAIYDRYGAAMLRNKCTIQVRLTTPDGQLQDATLRPKKFSGDPHPIRTYDGEQCGKTTIRMFTVRRDPKRKRKGQGVRVMDSTGYTLPLSERIFPAGLLKRKDVELFQSGHFEGEIIFSDKVQLDASRKFFTEDDATMEAVIHIERWLDEHGRKLIQQAEDEATSARYRRLGDQSLKVIDRFLKEQRNNALANLINSFKWGSQGIGHSDNSAKTSGTSTGTRANRGGSNQSRTSGTGSVDKDKDKSKCGKPREPKERKKDRPLVVNDPYGNSRARTRHKSTGLELSYDQGGKDLWKLNKELGIIHINITHPTWVAHDRLDGSTQSVRNQLICQLQERIILHVLLSLKLADDLGADLADILTFYAHEFEDHNHFLTTQADKIAQRGRFRPRSNSKKKEEDN